MSLGCAIQTDLGVVRDVLTTVDCNTRHFSRLGYDSLTASGSTFQTALTVLLTVYVAVIGYRLLFARGNASLNDGPGIALKIGAIVALVTSWSVFQTLVFDIAEKAPIEIASAIALPLHGGNSLAADPVGGLQLAYDQLQEAENALNKAALKDATLDKNSPTAIAPPPTKIDGNRAAAVEALSMASSALFATSAGLIAVILVAIGILTVIGPVFIALFLFLETRGFFVGWVRALAGAAFALLTTWTLNVLMLAALDPWLDALSQGETAGAPDSQVALTTAVIVFVFAAAQVGLLLAGVVIARGFSLGFGRHAPAAAGPIYSDAASSATPFDLISRPARLAEQLAQTRGGNDAVQWANRPAMAAAAARSTREDYSAPRAMGAPSHLGEMYRRPAVSRAPRQS